MFVSPRLGASRRGETGHSQRLWEAGSVCLGGSGKGCTDSIKIHFLPCSVTVIEVVMMGLGHYKFSK